MADALKPSSRNLILFCQILIAIGVLGKFYGLTDPWKRHDHYNFGGVWTTSYAECLKSTPLSVSKGVPHTMCWTPEPVYYRAHPPTILFAMWGWTSVFGSSEAAYRLFILTFSTLNIALIFFIARLARPSSREFPWLAATFQSVFLGNIYFGTHPDFIGEFTVTFVLLSALFALKRKMWSAGLLAILAGISSWPGYISLGPLWLYAMNIRLGRKRIFALACLGFVIALGEMMWLHQKLDIFAFLRMKLMDPGYVSKREKGWHEPFLFLRNAVSSWARLLSPVFASFAAMELFRGEGLAFWRGFRDRWQGLTSFHHAVWLAGGTGFLYALIGHEYFMVHVFLYLLMTPGLALLAARFCERVLADDFGFERREPAIFTCLILAFVGLYPYGIFQSSLAHDILNSLAFTLSAISLITFVWKRKLTPVAIMCLIAVGAAANVSQTINYRNEPDTERSFCEKARAEFESTHLPVHTSEDRSSAKDLLYCRGIPIEYEKKP